MKRKHEISGIRRKYLKYTIALLVLALTLSCIGIWVYVRTSVTKNISGKYEFMTERMGIALDTLYKKSDEITAECILYEDVQRSLQSRGLDAVKEIALGKYFAFTDLEHVADYCYVDNKGKVYARPYSDVTIEDVIESDFKRYLGDSYSKTTWFWAEDRLFGSGEPALFIGRSVRCLEYAHEPGMLFFKMRPDFLQDVVKADPKLMDYAEIGIVDANENICFTNIIQDKSDEKEINTLLNKLDEENGNEMILSGEKIPGGILSAYRQKETGLTVFSFVPNRVLNQDMAQIIFVLAGIYFVVVAVAIVLSLYFSERFTKPIQTINKAMTGFNGNDFKRIQELHTNTELDQIGHSYNEMLRNIELLLAEIKTQQKELRTSEMNMLISQINPHFMYNTLDTIYMLARINKEETTMKMIQALSKYLRLSLSKGNDIVTIEDELENVKSYMEIQQIRNANLFTYSIDCKVEAKEKWVLKLILQPLVENSIKYGFCDIFEGGEIRITVEEVHGKLILKVYNNGTSMEEEMCEKVNGFQQLSLSEIRESFPNHEHGYGLVNIITRLRLKYGDQVRLYYVREEEGTTCVVEIPGGGRRDEK